MVSRPVSFSYFFENGVENRSKARALFFLFLTEAKFRLGRRDGEDVMLGWLPSMVGNEVKSVDFKASKRTYHTEIVNYFLDILSEIEKKFTSNSLEKINVIMGKDTISLSYTDVRWEFFKKNADNFINGQRLSFVHLAEREQLQTLSEIYTGFPIQASRFLYIRQTSDTEKTTFATGLFQIHNYLGARSNNKGRLFSFLSSSSVINSENRDIYIEIGDLISSGSIVTAITSYESRVINSEEDVGSILMRNAFDTPIFQTVDEIRTFNFKIISSCCMRGVAFIKDGDYTTAITPCVAFPIEVNHNLGLDIFSAARSQDGIFELLEKYAIERNKAASRKALTEYFNNLNRIIISE